MNYTTEMLLAAGITLITVKVGYLLYLVRAYFWGNATYLDAHGSDPEVARANVIKRMVDKAVLPAEYHE